MPKSNRKIAYFCRKGHILLPEIECLLFINKCKKTVMKGVISMSEMNIQVESAKKYVQLASSIRDDVVPKLAQASQVLIDESAKTNAEKYMQGNDELGSATQNMVKVTEEFAESIDELAAFLKKVDSALN